MSLDTFIPLSGGSPITKPSSAVAILLPRVANTVDFHKMDTLGSGVVFRHPQLILTAGHVPDTTKPPGNIRGFVYCANPAKILIIKNIVPYNLQPPLDLKALIVEAPMSAVVANFEPLTEKVGEAISVHGFGGTAGQPPQQPPLLNGFDGKLLSWTAASFLLEAKPNGITHEGDSGSPALSPGKFDESFGIFLGTKDIGGNLKLEFLRFTNDIVKWVDDVIKTFGLPAPKVTPEPAEPAELSHQNVSEILTKAERPKPKK